jgi:hypothetical protein
MFITPPGSETQYLAKTLSISLSWQTASSSLSVAANAGNIFLKPYKTTTYTVASSGTISPGNHTVIPLGGTVSSTSGNGTFTYSADVTPFTTLSGITLALSTVFNRTAQVAMSGYSATSTVAATAITASFIYPSFYIYTKGVTTIPQVADIVEGTDFKTSVNLRADILSRPVKLADRQTTFGSKSAAVSIGVVPAEGAGIWFGILSTVDIGLNSFGSGSLPSNAAETSNGSTVKKETITLYTTGGNNVIYNMYGFTVNPAGGGDPTLAFVVKA